MLLFESNNLFKLNELRFDGASKSGILNRSGSRFIAYADRPSGNTRAIINRNKLPGGFADVQYDVDYYPYGMEDRSAGIDSRHMKNSIDILENPRDGGIFIMVLKQKKHCLRYTFC